MFLLRFEIRRLKACRKTYHQSTFQKSIQVPFVSVVKKYFYKNYYFIFLDGFDLLILKIKNKK
jgi:hypothetical protein